MITAGQQILHYRLVEKLGEGGMGVVWQATDTSLDRPVAIKVLPPHFAADPERLARFEREARLLASLNHANIATVYSVHVVDGERYLAMELVPGEDLAQRIGRGPVPVSEALEIARQIAHALEAAHESGVVHRDLKPANVRITPDGRVKVLDFGLAKALETSPSAPVLSQSPTFAASMASGMIIGTAAYMSPEQARGQMVDRRADIWAFGVVLFEMLTGRRAFEGETVSDTLAAVLRAEPDRALLPRELPRRIRALLDRCLQKDPRRRLRDIGEAVLALDDVQAGRADASDDAPAPAAARGGRARLVWGAGLVAVALLAAWAGMALRPRLPEKPLRKFTLALESAGAEVAAPMLSPDGHQIAFCVTRKLWVRDLGQLSSRMLVDGVDEDFRPLWSPDGQSIVFATNSTVSRVAVASGAVTPVCAVSECVGGAGGTWTADGGIVFAKGQDHLYSVSGGGGLATIYQRRVDSLEVDLHHPHMLPGGRGLLYIRHMIIGGPNTLALSANGTQRDLLALTSGLMWDPIYDPRGYIVFSRIGEGGGLWALPFSLDRLQVTGEAFLIAPEGGSPSVAADGNLVYRIGTANLESQPALVDRSGTVLETYGTPRRGNWSMTLSPDEKLLALESREAGEGDIWLLDLERKSSTRFAFGPGRQAEPAFSPDGRQLVWNELTTEMIMSRPTDGSRAPQPVLRGHLPQYTADGRYLVYCKTARTGTDIWYAPGDGSPDTLALVDSPASETWPMPAPQGGYLLYVSDESGAQEVYLRQFPTGTGRWQVSTQGGFRPVWSRKGDRIIYQSGESIYEVPVELQPAVRLGTPRVLFDLTEKKMQSFGRYLCVPTSRPDRFFVLKAREQVEHRMADVVVVENWPGEFRKK